MCIQQLVLILLYDCLLSSLDWKFQSTRKTDSHLKRIISTNWLEWYPCGRLKPATRIPPEPATLKLQHTSKQEHTTNVVIQ